MRDNSMAGIAAALAVLTVATAAPAQEAGRACAVERATTGARGQPTAEITTDQMEAAVAQVSRGVLIIDARPYEEFAMGHVPGAVCVAPRSASPTAQDTSDVGEIERLAKGVKNRTIVLYCDGLFCASSTQLASGLLAAGYTNVARYELGIPVWRALGHPTQAEAGAIRATLERDRTAVVIDSRGSHVPDAVVGARHVPFAEVGKAKDDGRLPRDHNTRIFVAGKDAREALAVAQEIARNAFSNVAFFAGSMDSLMAAR